MYHWSLARHCAHTQQLRALDSIKRTKKETEGGKRERRGMNVGKLQARLAAK